MSKLKTLRHVIALAAAFHAELWRRGRRVSRALGTDRSMRARLHVLPFLLFWRRRFGGANGAGLRASFAFEGHQLECRFAELCDFEVLEEIFVDDAYGTGLPAHARVIVDLGGHVGLASLNFAIRYPEARVIAVEPNPALEERLRRNTGQMARIEVDTVAVAGSSGPARLKVVGDSWAGTLNDREGTPVTTVTLDELLAGHGIDAVDILKIDIEGAEFEVLSTSDLDPIAMITGELHPSSPEQLDDLTARLEPAFDVAIRPGGGSWLVFDAHRRA